MSSMDISLDGGICFSLFCYGCIVRCVLFLFFLVSFVDYVVYLSLLFCILEITVLRISTHGNVMPAVYNS